MVDVLPSLKIKPKFFAKSVTDETADGLVRVEACICGKTDFKTIIEITERWAKRAFMKVRNCVHDDIRAAFQLLARTIIVMDVDARFFPESGECYDYFYNQVLIPSFRAEERGPRIRRFYRNLGTIRRKGLLRVLLKIYLGILPCELEKGADEDDLVEDSRNVFELFARVAEKDEKPIVLSHSGKVLKIAIVLVKARPWTSSDHYVQRICEFARAGINSIFVLAASRHNIEIARESAMQFFHLNCGKWLLEDVPPYEIESRGRNSIASCMILMRETWNQ